MTLADYRVLGGLSYFGDPRAPSKIGERRRDNVEVGAIFVVFEKGKNFGGFNEITRP
jgi:hypothetical protein